MIFKNYFIILFCGHLLGDFYFQSKDMSNYKKESNKWLLLHGVVYSISTIGFFIPIFNKKIVAPIIFVNLSHLIIDFLKNIIVKKVKKEIDSNICFIVDQLLHIVIIACVAYYMAENYLLHMNAFLESFFKLSDISTKTLLYTICLIMMNGKPYNIFVKELFKKYQPLSQSAKSTKEGAGGKIGFLERMIVILLCYLEQYPLIGLVLTAKSIARYKEITDKSEFAEYYLMGTLSSLLFAILSYTVIF